MADNRNYYCFCEDNCKFPTMTKEQILTAIIQAVGTGKIKDVDAGFITRIVEQNKGVPLAFWVGTQAEYNAIENKANNCFYIVTDDTMKEDIEAAVAALTKTVETLQQKQNEYGSILFEGKLNVGDGITVPNLDKYKLFAVGVKCDEHDLYTVVFCGKGYYGENTYNSRDYQIDGATIASKPNGTAYYFHCSLPVGLNNLLSLNLAKCYTTPNLSTELSNCYITDIRGIM